MSSDGKPSPRKRFSAVLILTVFAAGVAAVARGQLITEFPIPTANSGPEVIAVGPDGNLWFTERDANKIGRITPAGMITEFPILSSNTDPAGIAAGPDGNLWFTETNVSQIGRITTAGAITEFPTLTAFSGPAEIVAGPDAICGFPNSPPTKSDGSPRPAWSPNSRSRAAAALKASRPDRTATCGSLIPAPARSAASRRPA